MLRFVEAGLGVIGRSERALGVLLIALFNRDCEFDVSHLFE